MAISDVSICNMALSHVGARNRIESLDEKTPEAVACNQWYDFSLDQALEANDWTMARARFTLALDGQAPPDEWSFRYQYPAGCLVIRRIWNPAGPDADAIPFEEEINDAEMKTIVTDMENAIAVGTKRITSVSLFRPVFVLLLSHAIAANIAFTLTGKRAVVADQVNAFNSIKLAAPAIDANEHVAKPPRDAEWIRGRSFRRDVPPFTRGS